MATDIFPLIGTVLITDSASDTVALIYSAATVEMWKEDIVPRPSVFATTSSGERIRARSAYDIPIKQTLKFDPAPFSPIVQNVRYSIQYSTKRGKVLAEGEFDEHMVFHVARIHAGLAA
jgi:hypothetical protein